jgi:glycosyltransferase involved in cell wall biosynthesis
VRSPNAEELRLRLDAPLPSHLAVGGGTCLFVSGAYAHPRGRVKELRLLAAGATAPLTASGMPRPPLDGLPAGGFWGAVPIPASAAGRSCELELVATVEDGGSARRSIGSVELRPGLEPPPESASVPEPLSAAPGSRAPLIAICMATHDPPPRLLERQLASIRAQTHEDWVCLISDDCSPEESFAHLRRLTEGDPRFVVSRSARRLGFYRNFERALTMAPPEAALIALADQDDEWYPDKLASLLGAIGDAQLAYSDMRIVEESGGVISETYWSDRRNNHADLSSLLLANTVTGAASLFRRDLLDAALPFPPPLGSAYHDHWLAVMALARGRIEYLDRPLHDYVQHGAAMLGHAKANRGGRLRGLAQRSARGPLERGRYSYFSNVCRIGLTARVLEMRAAERLEPGALRAVRRLARLLEPPEPASWLALRSLRALGGRNETLGRELVLVAGIVWRRLAALGASAPLRGRPGIDTTPPPEALAPLAPAPTPTSGRGAAR